MMGRWVFSVAAATAVLVSGPPSSAQGLISKKYVLDLKQSDDVFRAITDAVPIPSQVYWPDLRRRLYKSSLPTDGFRFTVVADRIAISDDTPRPIIDVLSGGEAMKWKINDGQIIDVSAKMDGAAVLMLFRGRDYERTTEYRNVGQQLIAESTIVSPGLSAPIRYKLVYN